MRLLSTFFPRQPRPRTVVHAGPLLMRREGGVTALRRYLRTPRKREVFLLHQGQEPLRDIAKETGVRDIALESSAKEDANTASEMALALGARRLDFTIDEPGVSRADSDPLREITLNEAESLARDPEVRPKIRAKLRAGCEALRHGVWRVRIGDPPALARDRATVLVPDPSTPCAAREKSPDGSDSGEAGERMVFDQPPLILGRRGRRRRPQSGRITRAVRRSPRAQHCQIGVATREPSTALGDPWWRLRRSRTRSTSPAVPTC